MYFWIKNVTVGVKTSFCSHAYVNFYTLTTNILFALKKNTCLQKRAGVHPDLHLYQIKRAVNLYKQRMIKNNDKQQVFYIYNRFKDGATHLYALHHRRFNIDVKLIKVCCNCPLITHIKSGAAH